jgi:predicted nucleic acid-binding protein
MPDRHVVPGTSCLIALSALSLLDILDEFYNGVIIPHVVMQEFGEPLPEWVKPAQGDPLVVSALRQTLGHGEAEVIAVAAQRTDALAVLDDKQHHLAPGEPLP